MKLVMKFRDPKTGKVFEDIIDAGAAFCTGKNCFTCAVPNSAKGNLPTDSARCTDFMKKYPIEAARKMGYEVIDEEDPMEKMDKPAQGETQGEQPRICEVLGVEVGEEWRAARNDAAAYRLNEDGVLLYAMPKHDGCGLGKWLISDMAHLLEFINHPDRIIRKPRFTEEEVADAKVLARALLADGFERDKGGDVFATSSTACRTLLDSRMFPSIRPGQSIALSDICAS